MEITIEFDLSQKKLIGNEKILDVPDGTTLLDFLESVDELIDKACSSKGLNPDRFRTLNSSSNLNGCIATVNGQAPSGLLEHCLKDGDIVSLLYGYCGG